MSELRLVGLHDDGEHVVLAGPDGQRFSLPIDDALRAAVRRDRPQLEQVRAQAAGAIPPREMQARMRAGTSAREVAEAAGIPVEIVERYEGPVIAEREWVAQQARETRIGHDTGAPTLGDLVTDRLAARGIAQRSVVWDAFRDLAGPWSVTLTFDVADEPHTARWAFDTAARTLRAMDDEARWLSETELPDTPVPRRHLAAVKHHEPHRSVTDTDVGLALRPVLAAVDRHEPEPEPIVDDPFAATEALLDDLRDRRGVRQPLALDDDEGEDLEGFEGFGPQHAFDFDHPGLTAPPAAHPAASRPEEAADAAVLQIPLQSSRTHADEPGQGTEDASVEPSDDTGQAADGREPRAERRPRPRKGRASVPSWDEIVFGAKPE